MSLVLVKGIFAQPKYNLQKLLLVSNIDLIAQYRHNRIIGQIILISRIIDIERSVLRAWETRKIDVTI